MWAGYGSSWRMQHGPTHMSGYGCQLGTLGLLPLRHLSNRTAWASLHGGVGLHKGAWNSHLLNSVSQESHKANPGSRGEEIDSTHWRKYSCLENFMDRGAWWATVHGGPKEVDMTEWLTLSLSLMEGVAESHWKGMQLRGLLCLSLAIVYCSENWECQY